VKVTRREQFWIGLLLLTILAGLWPTDENNVPDSADRKIMLRDRTISTDARPALGALVQSTPTTSEIVADLFPPHSWLPPSPQPSANQGKPSAPALPFSYGGRYTEGEKVHIFLNEGTLVHTVRQGETVNATYRVEKIDNAAITLTYLPLGIEQTLETGRVASP
jgi:hypothetical protein